MTSLNELCADTNKCVDCGNLFKVSESERWKQRCELCFSKARVPKNNTNKTPTKQELDDTTLRIMFGNCLNASGMALSGSGTTPPQHYAYAKELFNLWLSEVN